MPTRHQRRRTKGSRTPPNVRYCGRGTRHGNPHRVGPDLTPEQAVQRFESDLHAGRLPVSAADIRRDLAGQDLSCWCRLEAPCHVDVLLRIANTPEPPF